MSIDHLKNPARYKHHLKSPKWNAVVIDECHNLINRGTRNSKLAKLLAAPTDAPILASAAPHNGKRESFAELVHLLDPTAIVDRMDCLAKDIKQLYVRRHRNSPDVKQEVSRKWKERHQPRIIEVIPREGDWVDAGAALTMAETVLKVVGQKRPALAMSIIGYIVSIPVFCDSGFVILSSLNKSLSRKTGVSMATMAVALSTGLYATHTLVPPTPGPIAAANALEDHLQIPREYSQIALYALLIAAGWYIYRFRLTTFRYTLTDSLFSIDRLTGRSERAIHLRCERRLPDLHVGGDIVLRGRRDGRGGLAGARGDRDRRSRCCRRPVAPG